MTTIDRINRLKKQGLDKSQIVARLTGTKDGSGGASQLTAKQLSAIGFSNTFITNLGKTAPTTTRPSGGGTSGGGTGGGTGGAGGDDVLADPYGDAIAALIAQQDAATAASEARNQQSAYQMFASLLTSWGIPVGPDIEAIIRAAAVDGYGPNEIGFIIPDIQQTQSWKTRFPGWNTRVSNGYNQISVGEYLALESAYHRILQSSGLPSGFYDDPSDFGQWIASNVSPEEIEGRVNAAMGLVRQVDPTARNLLTQYYGVGAGDLAAYFLDSARALPTLERQYKAVNVAAWAQRVGLKVDNMGRFEDLVDKGVTEQEAAEGYGTIRMFKDRIGYLGSIHGEDYNQADAERDVFFNDGEKRKRLVDKERATFSGRSGYGTQRRGPSTAGSF